MVSTLSDVVDLIKKGDDQIIEKQEEANDTLKSIDGNISEFLGLQKRKRLDDLEDRRERKSSSRMGLGAGAAGAALGAGALAMPGLMTGEGTGFGNIAKDLAVLYLKYKAIRTAFGVLGKGINKLFGSGADDIPKKLSKLSADLDAEIKSIDEKIKAKTAELDEINKRAAMDADGKAEADRFKRKQQQIQDELTRLADEKARIEKERVAAMEAEGKSEADRFKRKAASNQTALELEAQRKATMQAEGKAEAERFRRAQQNAEVINLETERLRRQKVGDAELERFNRRAQAANIPTAPRVKTTTPPIGMEYDDAILRRARTPAPRVAVPKASVGRTSARAIGKAAAFVAAPIDVAVSAALGGGRQVEEDVSANRRSTVNAVAAAATEDLVAGTVGLIDLAANIVNFGVDKLGQAITGDESFTVGRSDLGTAAGAAVRKGIEKTGLGAETTIGGGVAGGLVESRRVLTATANPQLESQIQMLERRKVDYKNALASGRLSQEAYDKRIASLDAKIATLRGQMGANTAGDTARRIIYSEPGTKTATISETAEAVQSAANKPAPAAIIDSSSRQQVDNSVRVQNVNQQGANNVDPSAYAVPGFGPR